MPSWGYLSSRVCIAELFVRILLPQEIILNDRKRTKLTKGNIFFMEAGSEWIVFIR